MLDALQRILASKAPSSPATSLAEWRVVHEDVTRDLALPVDRALVAGASAPRVAFAFASGYQSALEALIGEMPRGLCASFCVTERGGAHPRAIETTLLAREGGGYALTGHKRWTTMASAEGGLFFVAASLGVDEGGRNRIKLVRVASGSAGITVTPMPATPFIPEIPHAEVTFEGVVVGENDVLPGDGYDGYVKPFRTVEDVHVHAAVLAYLAGVARRAGFPGPIVQAIAALLVALRALAAEPPSSPSVHVALEGVIQLAQRLLDEASPHWALCDEETRTRWERDRVLLQVASKARAQRLESAYRSLAGP